jgi:FdhD protein
MMKSVKIICRFKGIQDTFRLKSEKEIMNGSSQSVDYYSIEAHSWTKTTSHVIVESSVSLTVNGEVWLTFMCTPIDLEALAVGFLFNEKLIVSCDEIASVRVCPTGDNVDVWLNHPVEKPALWKRTSGCTGGVTSIDANQPIAREFQQVNPDSTTISFEQITRLVDRLFEAQDLYRKSGGVHTSVLTDGIARYITGEDIGRHNTLDKIAGKVLLDQIDLEKKILLTTGRISSEMMQKASRIGASIVISRTSPSSLSIETALQMGITLIGYARRTQFRLYTHPERILDSQESTDTFSQAL